MNGNSQHSDENSLTTGVSLIQRQLFSSNGSLRAGVLGVNDGLVSNFSLVMGVFGGTGDPGIVMLAGIAGMLAGAFSMAAGEYVSMRSQRDVYEHQIDTQRSRFEAWPEEQRNQLRQIYQSKGLSEEEADVVVGRVMADPEVALDTIAKEGLGLNPSELGSPWGASISSFTAFGAGACVPVLPYLILEGNSALHLSGVLSAIALLVVGGVLAWVTERSVVWGAVRMCMAGSAAALVTFWVGTVAGLAFA